MVNIKTYISIALLFFIFISFSNDAYSAQNNNIKVEQKEYEPKNVKELFKSFYKSTGVYEFLNPIEGKLGPEKLKPMSKFSQSFGRILMIMICILLFYLAISKNFEPLLLLPIGFGGLLANIPIAEIAGPNGFLGILYSLGVQNGLFPIIIFMGVGAMTDFGPLIANPKTALLGAAAQFGIFGSLVGAVFLSQNTSIIDFSLQDSAAISIIGGADGPTAIFIASRLAPDLLGAIAVAAYSYMALVPIIQPPIMRALTSEDERKIKMVQLRKVNKLEKIFFPITLLILCILVLPDATPLVGALCFGNFLKESGAVDRLSDTMQNSLINIVTIFLGLAVGSKLAAEKFLVPETLGIIIIGLVAFSLGTATGVLMGKLLNKLSKDPINPLIGAAGVSAVPMAARVVSKVGNEEDSSNILLMHAMGPNVSGVIGSAVAAGVLISIFA
ncbi:sodium ion-translocating decarboxylase subunit beta [bacterium]|jgi:oxaloacetate decarboxylase beta subunit|nr:sodium ion-translocating decarboxylase subunit beta [bacterium]MBT3795363.1 sodium ion-translocating decarboxylase subunit beta [bacterium]MBT4634253.1 sodium ion-translocating decarboxylase subunit beta [bacterium]